MATSTRNTSGGTSPAIIENYERERVFGLFRQFGYLEAELNPLGLLPPQPHPDLKIDNQWAREARRIYCSSVGVEFMHIADPERRRWIQQQIEDRIEAESATVDQQRALDLLVRADLFEQTLQQRYLGNKRFSLEGNTSLLPAMDEVLDVAGERGAVELVMGMSHRGRLNVIIHLARRPPEQVFAEFEDVDPRSVLGSGDVKYHMGATGEYVTRSGKKIHIHLASNPSHLEAVDPVTVGRTRAKQDRAGEGGKGKYLPVLVHGDAAFAGQGITAETLNYADLGGYTVGGTIHVIVNNLIGFTTNAQMINGTYGATMTVGLGNEQDIQGAAPDDLGNLTINVQSTVTSNPSTQSGNYVLNGGTLSAPATKLTGSFTQSGGTATFAGITGTGTLTINGGTTMLATGSGASTVNSLTISSSGVFDMGNNKLYIDYGGGSDPISTIAGYLKTGSIDTSAPLTFNGLKYGLGFADSADKGNPAGLASGQVEVMYTLLGDANLDGTVNGEDFTILASNFNQSVTSWDQGDFNYDGTVNGEDFTLLAANFNQQVNGAASAGDIAAMDAFAAANGITLPTTSSVPEPASGVLALFGAGILARRARRRDDR